MRRTSPWKKHLAIAICVTLSLASITRAEDADRLRAEALGLGLLLQDTRNEMFNSVQFSAHGLLDSRVQALNVYATQVEYRLSECTRRLVRQDAGYAHSDLRKQLEAISADVAAVAERLSSPGILQSVIRTPDRTQNDGTESHLAPVHKRHRSPSSTGTDSAVDLRKNQHGSRTGAVK